MDIKQIGYTFETMDEWCALEAQLESATKSQADEVRDVAEKLLVAFLKEFNLN